MKKQKHTIIASLLAVMTLASNTLAFTPAISASAAGSGGRLGLNLDSAANLVGREILMAPYGGTLPASFDNTAFYPIPGNQGTQGSCVAFATGYAFKTHQDYLDHQRNIVYDYQKFSPAYIYNQINGGVDNGTTISAAMNLLESQGCVSLYDMPYNQNDWTTQPTQAQRAKASPHKSSSWGTVSDAPSDLKRAIIEYGGAVVGIPVYPDFDNLSSSNQVYDTTSGSSRGNHAICLIGYDDSLNAYKFINSWGTNWGLSGYGYISYDVVSTHCDIGYVMNDTVEVNNTSFADAQVIGQGEHMPVNITAPNQKRYYRFTAPSTHQYIFTSSLNNGICDPRGFLYDSEQAQIATDDDTAGSSNFRMVYNLTRGQTVYLAVGCYGNGTGVYQLNVSNGYPDFILGDVNFDGTLNIIDAVLTAQIAYDKLNDPNAYYTGEMLYAANVNKDSGVTSADTKMIQKYILSSTALSSDEFFDAWRSPSLSLNTAANCQFYGGTKNVYYQFTPTTTRSYTFTSSNPTSADPYGTLYDEFLQPLQQNDDGAGSLNFRITYTLEAGKTYFIGCGCYSGSTDWRGNYQVTVS